MATSFVPIYIVRLVVRMATLGKAHIYTYIWYIYIAVREDGGATGVSCGDNGPRTIPDCHPGISVSFRPQVFVLVESFPER